jgi:hypothetical protein
MPSAHERVAFTVIGVLPESFTSIDLGPHFEPRQSERKRLVYCAPKSQYQRAHRNELTGATRSRCALRSMQMSRRTFFPRRSPWSEPAGRFPHIMKRAHLARRELGAAMPAHGIRRPGGRPRLTFKPFLRRSTVQYRRVILTFRRTPSSIRIREEHPLS